MYDDMYETYPHRNAMASAALVFGLISIFTCAVIYISLPAGALAFLFALLSRTQPKMSGKGKAGIVCGLLGMVLTVVITAFSFYFVLTNDTARAYMNQYFRYYTGDPNIDFEEELNELFSTFGFSSDLFLKNGTLPDSSLGEIFPPVLENTDIPDHACQEEGAAL